MSAGMELGTARAEEEAGEGAEEMKGGGDTTDAGIRSAVLAETAVFWAAMTGDAKEHNGAEGGTGKGEGAEAGVKTVAAGVAAEDGSVAPTCGFSFRAAAIVACFFRFSSSCPVKDEFGQRSHISI